ncbi:ClpP/crotonase-like domain-containing protein [Pelagophyceae sp. CCMP2097]|nr:ClpP/crotonase-like domain-containing protein [Pelagophyceae sp. CCMP2097]
MLSNWKPFLYGAAFGGTASRGALRLADWVEERGDGPTCVKIVMAGNIEADGGFAPSQRLNVKSLERQLSKAFATPRAKAVVLEINSPGGSPAQANLLHARLQALRRDHADVELLCFATDCVASGGYYVAAAADEIFVLPSTLVGSIGVISPSVGLVEVMAKCGIEDRTLTAGDSKAGDNPLAPRDADAVARKKAMLLELHGDFMQKVADGRGDRLQHGLARDYAAKCGVEVPPLALFDGSVYCGVRAVEFGLADALYSDVHDSLKLRYGADVRVTELKMRTGVVDKLLDAAEMAGASAVRAAVAEAKATLRGRATP